MNSPRILALAGLGVAGAFLFIRRQMHQAARPTGLKLHIYDHCPFCIRVALVLGRFKIPFQQTVYGYGDMVTPKQFTGKKCLPVLEGVGVPAPRGNREGCLDESSEIISFLTGTFGLTLPCRSGRSDLADWTKRFSKVLSPLQRPRIIKMPIFDWASQADVEYAVAKYTKQGFDYDGALAQTSSLIAEMNELLKELCGLMSLNVEDASKSSVNCWGFGMDDVCLLPDLRRLTCVKGIEWPAPLLAYVEYHCKTAADVNLYSEFAC